MKITVFLFKRVAVADSGHGDSMSGIQFPSITGYFSHYCQNRSQKLPRIITSEVWERTEPYLHTLCRPCITTQTSGPASYAEGPEVQISSVVKLKFTMGSSFPSNASMAPKIRTASFVYTPSKSSVINYPTIRCYIELLAASL
jgi:hypothetical protein